MQMGHCIQDIQLHYYQEMYLRDITVRGEQVLYVSGSDCHGTPISVRARLEGVEPTVITNQYHEEFQTCFNKLGFSYDIYTRTDEEFHKEEV